MSTARLVEKFLDCAGHAVHAVDSPVRVAEQLLDIGAAPSVRTLLVSLFPETEIESW
jgi:hypothetical protein